MKKLLVILSLSILLATASQAQQLAFPGAEGFGRFTKGGRGGTVYEVTNLNDSGAGSLRAAVEASGPRTVVFRVSGTIALADGLEISNPFITIAGQTAPGDGICIKNYPLEINDNQVIVRYIRVRLGDTSGTESDAISSRYYKNIILDHLSASWSVDETMSVYNGDSTTVQWCLVSESLYESNHGKGTHGYGGIWGGNHYTYHHNLLAHHSSRNPRFSSGCGYTDYVNNVVYNWGYMSCYGAEEKDAGNPSAFSFAEINMRNNYYKPGPATTNNIFARPSTRDGVNDLGKWHVEGNSFYKRQDLTNNNWLGVTPDDGLSYTLVQPSEPFNPMPIEMQTAEEAYNSVLDNVGATLPRSDTVDKRILGETHGRYTTYEGIYKSVKSVANSSVPSGIIDSQADVGGWPMLNSLPAPDDTDHDGIPDDWEDANALDKSNPNDRNSISSDGYTMLEVYLNSIEFNYPVVYVQFANADDENNILVSWSDNFLGEDGFIIEKSTNGIDYTPLVTVAKNVKEYTDVDQAVKPELRYRIAAFQNSFVTPYSSGFIDNSTIEIITPVDIYIEDTVQMLAELLPENSSNRVLKWAVEEEYFSQATISNSGLLVALDSGMIELSVETSDSLELSSTKSLNINLPTIEILNKRGIETGDTVQLRTRIRPTRFDNRDLLWDVLVEDQSKAKFDNLGQLIALDSGTVQVTVRLGDLEVRDTLAVYIEANASGVQNSNTSIESFTVFPNPFRNRIEISLSEKVASDASISLYNSTGLIIMQAYPGAEQIVMDTESLPFGIYLLSIRNNRRMSNSLIVKSL